MPEFTRSQIRYEFKRKLSDAVKREHYEAFKEILALAEIVPGSDRYRSLEAAFWRAVAEHRRKSSELL
jgi:hypothetical protein